MGNPARFYRTDFQIHSPRDNGWFGKRPRTEAERKAYAERFVLKCRECGLEAIAITDHDDVAFVRDIQLAAQTPSKQGDAVQPELQDPVVFPGVELNLAAVPCQAIVLLSAEMGWPDYEALLHLLGIQPHPATDPKGPKPKPHNFDLAKLDKTLRDHTRFTGNYIILPHVGDDGSHKTLLRKDFQTKFMTMPCVGGYIEQDYKDHKKMHLLDGSERAWTPRGIGLFQTSDYRGYPDRQLGCRSTWVKIAEPTAEALRQACLGWKSRISQTAPEVPSRYISRVEVSDSKFMGCFSLDLSQQFNVLIGGRGTGKSTILEYIRWAMQDKPRDEALEPDAYDSVSRKRETILQTLLDCGGAVSVYWKVNDVEHVVKWHTETDELTLEIDGSGAQPETAESVRHLLPIRAYSQKQLSTVSVRRAELTNFVEQPVRNQLVEIDNEIRELGRALKSQYAEIVDLRNAQRELRALSTELRSTRQRAGAIEKALPKLKPDVKKTLGEHAHRLKEAQAVEEMQQSIHEVREWLEQAIEEFADTPAPLSLHKDSPQRSQLQTLHNELALAVKEIVRSLHTSKDRFAKKVRALQTKFKAWDTENHKYHQRYQRAQTKMSQHKKRMSELQNLREGEARVCKEAEKLEKTVSKLPASEKQFGSKWKQWVALHKKRGDVLKEQCDLLAQRSGGYIRAEFIRGGDCAAAIGELQAALGGCRISGDRWTRLQRDLEGGSSPAEAWLDLMEQLRPYAEMLPDDVTPGDSPRELSSWKLTQKMRLAMVGRLTPERWVTVATTSLKDRPVFYYSNGKVDIPFEEASAGQQATALLKALLSEPGGPLIIDQPEEDLDNSVMDEIVTQVWEAKKHRQIIFASHNANLVVNGDAELVVHCDYEPESGRTKGTIRETGAIDCREIRNAITKVMEGGKEAFLLRKDKYGF